MDELKAILKRVWGYDSFRPLQAEAMDGVLKGEDTLVVLPTGGGKSLCYQAPALAMPGFAVVISPLISLMKDQVESLAEWGVPAACLNSAATVEERREAARAIRQGELKLLYVSPERLTLPGFLDYLKTVNVSFFAVDEAHCISHWGHDFRPEYRGLSILRERFPGKAIHAYTATATKKVRDDIARQLCLRKPRLLVGSFFRANLIYGAEPMRDRLGQVKQVIARHPKDSGLIYCISRKKVESLAEELRQEGFKALPYHAGLDDAVRKRNQEAFMQEKADIIVATVAFGMGIDKSNVRYVIHAGMPKSLEHYLQESGRAGRDGLDAECILLHSPSDAMIWRKILADAAGEQAKAIEAMLSTMEAYCHGGCRHKRLIEHFGERFGRESCEACDVCLGGKELVPDSMIVGQKILSCAARLGEKAPARLIAAVLKGGRPEELDDPAHAGLSTWGLLRDTSFNRILDWIEQLRERGHLEARGEALGLAVTEAGWRVLRGKETPRLFMPPAPLAAQAPAPSAADSWRGVDRDLFEMLRGLRRGVAQEQGVPAFVIFSDATLREMAQRRPSSAAALLKIKGVGERKAEVYGADFLRVVADYCAAKSVPLDSAGA